MNYKIITNNPMIIEKNYSNIGVISGDTLEVLLAAKKIILEGYPLISHPLTSSIRPDISPYKTILLGSRKSTLDHESLKIINDSINYTSDLMKNNTIPVSWDDKSLKDFQYVDMDIILNLLD